MHKCNNIVTLRVFKTEWLAFKVHLITFFFWIFVHLQLLVRYHEFVASQFLEKVRSIIEEDLLLLMFVNFLKCRSRLGLHGVVGNLKFSWIIMKKISSPQKTSVVPSEGSCGTKLGVYVPSGRTRRSNKWQIGSSEDSRGIYVWNRS